MAIRIGELLVKIGAETGAFQTGIKSVEDRLKKFGEGFTRAGLGLSAGLTVPLAAAGGAAFKFSADFERALARSTAIMGDLSEALKSDIEDAAKNVARSTTFSASQTAESFFFLASAGLDAAQSIAALPQVAQFATAGAFDLSRATDLLTDAQSALGLSTKDAAQNLQNLTRVSDVLVGANTLANASVEQFAEALTNRAGAAARLAGKDVEEVTAVLAVFADQGIKSQKAGTLFEIVLRDLGNAAIKNRDAFRDAKIAVFDANGAYRNLADIIEEVERKFGSLSKEQQKIEIEALGFPKESISALQFLIGGSGKIREFENRLRQVGGLTQTVAERNLKNLADQFDILEGKFELVAISFGQALKPAFEGLGAILDGTATALEKLGQEFETLEPETRKTIGAILGLAAAAGPLALALGVLSFSLSSATTGVRALGTAFVFLAKNPIALVITGLAAYGIALARVSGTTASANVHVNELALNLIRLGKSQREARLEALSTEIQRLEKDFNSFVTEQGKYVEILERSGGANATAEKAIQDYGRAINDVLDSLDGLRAEQRRLIQEQLEAEKAQKDATKALDEARKAADELGKSSNRLGRPVRELKEVFEDWQAEVAAIGAEFEIFGDANRKLQDELSVTEAAIQDIVAAALKAGVSLDELSKDADFRELVAKFAELRMGIRAFSEEDLTRARESFREFALELNITATELAEGFQDAFNQLVSGVARAAANAIVFTQDFGRAAKAVLADVLSSILAFLIRLALEQAAAAIIGAGLVKTQLSGRIGASAARGGAAAAAAGIEELGLAGLIAAPAFAAAGIGAVLGGAASGLGAGVSFGVGAPIVAAAEGVIATRPTLAAIAEKPGTVEGVFPLSRFPGLMGGTGSTTVILEVDGRTVAQVVVPHVEDVVRWKIGNRTT